MEENLLPSITLPDALAIPGALDIPTPTLEQPTVEIPTFPTIVIAPTVLAPPVGVITADLEEILEEELARKQEGKPPKPKQEAAEVKRIDIPFTDLTFPVPKEEILITAGTTASVSVIATLTVTSLFKQTVKVMKPIIMQIAKRIQKKFNGNTTGKTEESSE
tara:strand:- start:357 stop:842 length:486 start_codon:yes stop_codon:yes gene_type:complete